MKKRKIKIGDIFSIPLPNKKYAFGRLFNGNCLAIYKHLGNAVDDIPEGEDYNFIVGVYQSALKSENWVIVENRPFKDEEKSWAPPMCMIDKLSGKYSIYHKGEIRPSTEKECEGLEVAAVWDANHIMDRIMGDNSWNPR